MKLYAVRDIKAECYGAPMSIATKGLAVRSFCDAAVRPDSDLSRYPEDYMLFEIGEYDTCSAKLTAHREPVFIMSATEAIDQARALRKSQQVIQEVSEVKPEVSTEN